MSLESEASLWPNSTTAFPPGAPIHQAYRMDSFEREKSWPATGGPHAPPPDDRGDHPEAARTHSASPSPMYRHRPQYPPQHHHIAQAMDSTLARSSASSLPINPFTNPTIAMAHPYLPPPGHQQRPSPPHHPLHRAGTPSTPPPPPHMGLSPAQGQGLPHPLSARYTLTTIAPPTAGAAAPYLQIPTGSPQPQQPGQAQSQHTPQPGSPSQSQSQSPSDTNPSSPFRLPPILQVEKQHVTTTATQAASASRRRNDALFKCPVPGCGSTFTRRFNLRGHLRSHTEERPFVCEWPGCGKGFARQHDCKRHQALHSSKSGQHTCEGCSKTFSRMDALNRHLRSEGGSGCRQRSQPGESSRGAASSSASGSGSASSVAGPSMSSAGQAMPVPPPVAGTRRHRKDDPEDGDERRPAPSNR